jgi:hypothetical protein
LPENEHIRRFGATCDGAPDGTRLPLTSVAGSGLRRSLTCLPESLL